MFPRVKQGGNREHPHGYLLIVEAYREGGKPKQRVVANLGRLDKLQASGELDRLVEGLGRFCQQVRVLSASAGEDGVAARTRLWGPPLVFGRLWERQGVGQVLRGLAAQRRFGFDVERVAFAQALQRLCVQGSDLQGSDWVRGVEAEGFAGLELQHFYRTAAFLHDVRADLERELFERDRDLFGQEVDLLFMDTTSLYVWRDTETRWLKRGYSREKHPELPQFVLGVAVDRAGWPVAWELFPGNTMDRKAFLAMVEVVRSRLRVRRVLVVADRAMISKDTLKTLVEDREAPFDYVLGCRMRQQKEVREEVLARGGRYHGVADNLEVKEVRVEGRRYVVCRNPDEARKDAAVRQAILDRLEAQLRRSPKEVVGNQGFRRFLRVERGGMRVDRTKVEADARLDGKFVLRTNTELPTDEVAKTYKSLWRVERTFREEKSTLEVRPIYHHCDPNRIGHIVASFLALRLEVDLQRRLDERGVNVSWPDLMRDLGQVQAVYLDVEGRTWRIRTDFAGQSYAAFAAVGLRPPPRIALVEEGGM